MQVVKLSKDIAGLGAKGDLLVAVRRVDVRLGDWVVVAKDGRAVIQRWQGGPGPHYCVIGVIRA